MRGRCQIHVPLSDFFSSASDLSPALLLCVCPWPVRTDVWSDVCAGWSGRNDCPVWPVAENLCCFFFLTLWGKKRKKKKERNLQRSDRANRNSIKSSPAGARTCRWFSVYRWPHSSISHNSAARQESGGPPHSSVIFHSSSSFAILLRKKKGIEFLL